MVNNIKETGLPVTRNSGKNFVVHTSKELFNDVKETGQALRENFKSARGNLRKMVGKGLMNLQEPMPQAQNLNMFNQMN